jgi:hypothetical protein
MAAATEHDIAFSMILLWGRDATSLAKKYAQEFEDLSNPIKAERWHTVQRIVARWNGKAAQSAKADGCYYFGSSPAHPSNRSGCLSMPNRL